MGICTFQIAPFSVFLRRNSGWTSMIFKQKSVSVFCVVPVTQSSLKLRLSKIFVFSCQGRVRCELVFSFPEPVKNTGKGEIFFERVWNSSELQIAVSQKEFWSRVCRRFETFPRRDGTTLIASTR